MSYVYCREKFFYAVKRPEESLQDWIKRLESLADSCNFSQEKDILLCDIFLIGLGCCHIQEKLVKEIVSDKNICFTKLKQKALDYEKTLIAKHADHINDNLSTNIISITKNVLENTVHKNDKDQLVNNSFGKINSQTNISANQIIQNIKKFRDPILPFNLRAKLSTFQGRQIEIKQLHDYFEKYLYKIVVISGLFGIGKTELANKYAWEYMKYYDNNIIWIQYETEEQFKHLFCMMGKEIDPKNYNCQKPIGQLVNDIYSYFENKHKCLFIFDDILSRSYINDILPNDTYKNIRLLITSPYAKWGDIKTINLSFLSDDETILLFKNVSKHFPCSEEHENYLKEISNGLPLLVQMFALHIIDATGGNNKKCSFSEYSANILYCKSFPKWSEQNSEKTAYNSFVTILQKIRYLTEGEESNIASKILNYFPYFEDIPVSLLRELFDKHVLDNVVRILTDCFLVYCENNHIYMDKFLQDLILLIQQKSQSETMWYKEILNVILNTEDCYEVQERKIFNFAAEKKEVMFKVYKSSQNQGKLIYLLNKYKCQLTLDYIFNLKGKRNQIKHEHTKETVKLSEGKVLKCFVRNEICHPVRDAAINGQLDVIKLFIEADQKLVYVQDEHGCIPFHSAAAWGHIHILTYFLQIHKVPINIQNKNGCTALHLAAQNGKTNTVYFLLEEKASIDISDENGNTALHYACRSLNVETIKILLKTGIDIDVRNEKGDTPLHFAALEGKTKFVEYLKSEGANIDARDDFNNNAIHFSAQKGHVDTTKTLIDLGCPKNVENCFGHTPLNLAIFNRQLMSVKLFCENGFRPNEMTGSGFTPMSIASACGFTEICSYFINQFPELYKETKYNETEIVTLPKCHQSDN